MEDNYDVMPLARLGGPGYVYAVRQGLHKVMIKRYSGLQLTVHLTH